MSADHRVVQTVLGAIDVEALGVTLPHEHLLIDIADAYPLPLEDPERRLASQPVSLETRGWVELHWNNKDDLVLGDEGTAIAEAKRYYEAGGSSIIDVTPQGIGRNPAALARIARATGLNVVMGCGYYVAITHPPHVARMSESEIAREVIDEFDYGVEETGVRPGVIGEIGCSWPMTPAERKVLRGAAVAQREVQCGLTVHPGSNADAPREIIDELAGAGADVERVIVSHIERTISRVEEVAELASTGCYVEFDLFGVESTAYMYRELMIDIPSDAQRLDQLRELVKCGYRDKILISQDVCYKHRLLRYGGQGYDHILRNIVPWMRQRGFAEADIQAILVENPRRAFAMAPR